jgi:hypothetical protein
MNTAAATAVQASHEQSINCVEQVSNPEAVRLAHEIIHLALLSASHTTRCVACHGVGSHAVPVALVGEWSIPVV